MTSLDSIQSKAVEKMASLKAGAVFLPMGGGKTKVALEIARSRRKYFDVIAWVCPASLLHDSSYMGEIERRNDGLPIEFFSIEGVSESDSAFLHLVSLAEAQRVFCIVDESLTIKNADAGRTKRLLTIRDKFAFRLILNGTPCSKGLIDLWSQMEFVSPRVLNMTEAQFAHNFLRFKIGGYKPWNRWSLPENEAALVEMIRPYIFDADIDHGIGYETVRMDHSLSFDEAQEYSDYKRWFLSNAADRTFIECSQAFGQFTCLSHGKLANAKSAINSEITSGRSVIVFCRFHKELDHIIRAFDALEYSGRVKHDTSELKKPGRVMAITYGTGSRGLNLQFASRCYFFGQTFDWWHKEHSRFRLVRPGQQSSVVMYDAWGSTGLDKLMEESNIKKTRTHCNVSRLVTEREALEL